MEFSRKLLATAALAFVALQLAGCATPATVKGMTIRTVAPTSESSPLFNEVSVGAVNGGNSTNPMWTSEIDSDRFSQALRNSLASVGMLAATQGVERYLLDADLLAVDQPTFGFTFTVAMRVRYMLRDLIRKKIIYNQIISSTGLATIGDAFVGVKRLRLANEAAARNNIAILIKALQELQTAKVLVK